MSAMIALNFGPRAVITLFTQFIYSTDQKSQLLYINVYGLHNSKAKKICERFVRTC